MHPGGNRLGHPGSAHVLQLAAARSNFGRPGPHHAHDFVDHRRYPGARGGEAAARTAHARPAKATSLRACTTPRTSSTTRRTQIASATTFWTGSLNYRTKPRIVDAGAACQRATGDLGSEEVVLEFSREIIHKLVCPHCGAEEDVLRSGRFRHARRGPLPELTDTCAPFIHSPAIEASRNWQRAARPTRPARSSTFLPHALLDAEIAYCIAGDARLPCSGLFASS